jgi:hypothetical protein
MKTKLSFFFLFVVAIVMADDKKYIEAMTKNIEAMYKAKTVDEYQQAINVFDRIGNSEKTKWEPFYYSSYGYLMMSFQEKEAAKKDQLLDLSEAALAKAKAIKENESEIVAMDGFIQMIRLAVDPASRGAKYSGMAMNLFGKAVALNPENPRALMLTARMQFGSAKFFNSPITEACATTTKALEKFKTDQSANPLAPQWGKTMADGLAAQCK